MTRFRRILPIIAVMIALPAADASAAALYDPAAGTTPNQQGWTYLTNPLFGGSATQSVSDGVLSLDTRTNIGEQAGYFSKFPLLGQSHPNHPTLDLSASHFSISITMQQIDGQDTPDTDPLAAGQRNRGGLSLIAIGEDLRGIELQFQNDRILSLDNANSAFPIGEVAEFDTSVALRTFDLRLGDHGYQLLVDGTSVLAGSLRNYSGIAPAGATQFVYQTPSFLFVGDNTGRGAALTRLGPIAVTAVPEPSMLLLGMAFVWPPFQRRATSWLEAKSLTATSFATMPQRQ